MCDLGWGEEAEVYVKTEVAARRVYACCECGMSIPKGQRHTKNSMLSEGSWRTYRSHSACHALVEHIALEVCQQRVIWIGTEPLRERVREHQEHSGVLRMWRDILRARRAEGVWPRATRGGSDAR